MAAPVNQAQLIQFQDANVQWDPTSIIQTAKTVYDVTAAALVNSTKPAVKEGCIRTYGNAELVEIAVDQGAENLLQVIKSHTDPVADTAFQNRDSLGSRCVRLLQ